MLSSACESSILVDPKMSLLNSIVRKAAFVWNKLSRYQHHCTFLKLCLARNIVPVGFNFRFHLALNIDNANLNTFCKHSLQRTSRDICNAVLLASQEKVNLLQQELRLHRELLFSRLSYDSAFLIWNDLKSENEILLHTLKEREKRKWLKTIPLDHGLDSSNSTDNPPTTRRSRRYDKFGRLLRKRQYFRQKRRMLNAANVDQLHQLDPVNLSTAPMDADQVNLLRKGPSFCPTPKDINWQSVYDDLEIFEARLRTAAFFMESNLDDSPAVPSQLPQVPKDRKWKPPTSRYPELELFLANVRRDIINPENIIGKLGIISVKKNGRLLKN